MLATFGRMIGLFSVSYSGDRCQRDAQLYDRDAGDVRIADDVRLLQRTQVSGHDESEDDWVYDDRLDWDAERMWR